MLHIIWPHNMCHIYLDSMMDSRKVFKRQNLYLRPARDNPAFSANHNIVENASLAVGDRASVSPLICFPQRRDNQLPNLECVTMSHNDQPDFLKNYVSPHSFSSF